MVITDLWLQRDVEGTWVPMIGTGDRYSVPEVHIGCYAGAKIKSLMYTRSNTEGL